MDKVVMVLTYSRALREARLFRDGLTLFGEMRGVYRLDDPDSPTRDFVDIRQALKFIRDHGGEWIAGEPLPEKPEEVWARFAMPEYLCANTPHYYRCGRCLDSWFGNPTRPRCPHCDAKLASSQPWISVRAGGNPR